MENLLPYAPIFFHYKIYIYLRLFTGRKQRRDRKLTENAPPTGQRQPSALETLKPTHTSHAPQAHGRSQMDQVFKLRNRKPECSMMGIISSAVWHMELCSMLCGSLMRGEFGGKWIREFTWLSPFAGSLETIITWLIGYSAIHCENLKKIVMLTFW